MDICSIILKELETNSEKSNLDIITKIFNEFIYFDSEDVSIRRELNFKYKDLRSLKKEAIYGSKYEERFFQLLDQYNYFYHQEIKDAIFDLGHLSDPNLNSEVINKYLNSPYIQDISFNGKNEFRIFSEQLGEFSFVLASYYFKEHESMSYYLQHSYLPNRCHEHAYKLSSSFPMLFTVTSLCKSFFVGRYYHSYGWNKETNEIIDLCRNAVFDKALFDFLHDTYEVSIIPNSELEENLFFTYKNTAQPYTRYHILKIVLYKQYLESIGYTGKLEDAPSPSTLNGDSLLEAQEKVLHYCNSLKCL